MGGNTSLPTEYRNLKLQKLFAVDLSTRRGAAKERPSGAGFGGVERGAQNDPAKGLGRALAL